MCVCVCLRQREAVEEGIFFFSPDVDKSKTEKPERGIDFPRLNRACN